MQQRENAVTFMKQHCYCFLSLWQFCQLFGISQVGCLSQLQTKALLTSCLFLAKKHPPPIIFPFRIQMKAINSSMSFLKSPLFDLKKGNMSRIARKRCQNSSPRSTAAVRMRQKQQDLKIYCSLFLDYIVLFHFFNLLYKHKTGLHCFWTIFILFIWYFHTLSIVFALLSNDPCLF